eukprot:TRINITY_DN24612_c0_g1_i1.p1 TRINITY_DN24612_c0_g1~~TRINITY_DN24612_c0_g1_i1.p1  ORF type:complete len:673 (-),score=73.43 TRINITY_DN24612_c0_g1_i1:90-2108(-)
MCAPDSGQECDSFEKNMRTVFCRFGETLKERGCRIDKFGGVPTPDLAYILERQGDVVLAEVLRMSGRPRLGADSFFSEMQALAGQSIKLKGRWKHIARFCSVDRHRRGKLVRQDVLAALEKICPSAVASLAGEALDDAFAILDPNFDGSIELEEWLSVFWNSNGNGADSAVPANAVLQRLAGKVPQPIPVRTAVELQSHLDLMMRFHEADLDDDGRLSTRELGELLHRLPDVQQPIVGPMVKQSWTAAEVKHLHQKFDRDGYGKLYFADFMALHDSGALTPLLTPPNRSVLFTSWNRDSKAFFERESSELIGSDLVERVSQHLLRGGQVRLLKGNSGMWAKLEQLSRESESGQTLFCSWPGQPPQTSRSLPFRAIHQSKERPPQSSPSLQIKQDNPLSSRSLVQPSPPEEPASARSRPTRKLGTSKFATEPPKAHANSSSSTDRGMPSVPDVAWRRPSLRMVVESHFVTQSEQNAANPNLSTERATPVAPESARAGARFRGLFSNQSNHLAGDIEISSSSDEADSSSQHVAPEHPSTPARRSSQHPDVSSESIQKDLSRSAKRRSSWSGGSNVPASVGMNRLRGAALRRLSALDSAPMTANQAVTSSTSQAQNIKAAMLGTANLPSPTGSDQARTEKRRLTLAGPVQGPSFVDYAGFRSPGMQSPRIRVPPI